MKLTLLSFVLCGALAAVGCGQSDEDLCEEIATKCGADSAAADGTRKLCLQQLDSKACGSSARTAYECAANEGTCSAGVLQVNKCLSEVGAYLECIQEQGEDQADTPTAD